MKRIEIKQNEIHSGLPATFETQAGKRFTGIIDGVRQGKLHAHALSGVIGDAYLLTLRGRIPVVLD